MIVLNDGHTPCRICGEIPIAVKGANRDLCPSCHVIQFYETLLTHTKGRWADVKFDLIPWEREIISKAFGTLKANGKRQYRIVYVEIPKKNGKSELGAGIALYGLVGDNEDGAEVYSAAGDREQAALVYNVAAKMVHNKPTLNNRLKVIDSRKRIVDFQTNSFYQVLSSESFTKHGINPSCIVFDELHAQPNRELWDVLTEGTDVAREQQLIFVITTAGVADKTSIGWEVHEYACKVRDGVIDDPTFLPIIYAADHEAFGNGDWEKEETWIAANPSLGHVFDLDNLRTHYKQVKANPARLNNFLRFRLNLWVGQISRYIPMDKWDACSGAVDPGKLLKRPCYAGLDLSSSTDLTALVLVFPPQEEAEKWQVLCQFFVPEENMHERARKDSVPYDMWTRAGLITTTPGNVVDYKFVRQAVNNAAQIYDLREVAFDPWGAVKLATELQEEDGIKMVEHRQGFKSMSPPTKELLKMVLGGELAHGGNKVLRWNADNLCVKIDPAENVKPEKAKSAERIDGVVALIMALGRALLSFERQSVYKKRGLVLI